MSEFKIDFTSAQVHDLRHLADRLRSTPGDLTDNHVWFAHYAGIYLARLALDAETEKLPQQPVAGGISTRVIQDVRLATLLVIRNTLGWSLAADGLLKKLKAVAEVDNAVANVLRRDIERLDKHRP
jgi:hypothetical protein